MEHLQKLLFRLCSAPGMSDAGEAAVKAAEQELKQYGTISCDPLGDLVYQMGNSGAKWRILLDAYIDQVDLLVAGITERGFLHLAAYGGADRRTLPGATVTVFGREFLRGVVYCLPPRLVEGSEEKVGPVDKMYVDIDLSREEAERLVTPGSRTLQGVTPRTLLSDRFTAAGLDNRTGVCTMIHYAELLAKEKLGCSVTILLSTHEEVGSQGTKTNAFAHDPTEAITVDVGFTGQPGVPEQKSGKTSAGPVIGVAPTLDQEIADELVRLAKECEIPFQYEVMGGTARTNADSIGTARSGVRCALASVPLRYMHTLVEVIDIVNIENTAKLLAVYVRGGEYGRCDAFAAALRASWRIGS